MEQFKELKLLCHQYRDGKIDGEEFYLRYLGLIESLTVTGNYDEVMALVAAAFTRED